MANGRAGVSRQGLFGLFLLLSVTVLQGAEPNGSGSAASPNDSPTMSADQARSTVQSLLDLAVTKLPGQYSGDKHWGETKKVWAGIKLRREGLKLSTKRRWKELRHGQWVKYTVKLPQVSPTRRPLNISVQSVKPWLGDDGALLGWTINTVATTKLDFTSRIERWNLGVQWYSVEVKGDMQVRMSITSRLRSYPDYSEIPPAIVIDPTVQDANLKLEKLHVDRVSKIGGEVAEQWGEVLEKVTQEILLEDVNKKLPSKLNKAIDKHRDDLRLSANDWFSDWLHQDE